MKTTVQLNHVLLSLSFGLMSLFRQEKKEMLLLTCLCFLELMLGS